MRHLYEIVAIGSFASVGALCGYALEHQAEYGPLRVFALGFGVGGLVMGELWRAYFRHAEADARLARARAAAGHGGCECLRGGAQAYANRVGTVIECTRCGRHYSPREEAA